MDRSFNDRVDKVFGSISSSASSTPWTLTDAQVERRVWNRDKADNRDDDDETLVSSSFDNLFNGRRNRRKNLEDLSDDDGDVGGDDDVQTENDGDEWDIRSSIGLDSTLDNEEEEDAYDKMAEGREDAGERLYMKDVTNHGPYLNSHNVLPTSLPDPCEKTRLKEDDEPMLNAEEANREEDGYGTRIKSILKRKNDDDDDDDDDAVKPAKRVRFDPTCKNDDELRRNANAVEPQGFGPAVPDYVVNPSKYTRYDFDDVSERFKFNHLEQIKKPKEVGVEEKSVVFIPRRKRGDGEDDAAANREKQSCIKKASGINIAAVAVEEQGQDMQEEDTSAAICTKKPGPGRRYRSRPDTAS
ncbi:hypothetical protein L1887_32993 [Cichorium endivia]|nr:hypothetical protein L1887_32993 [Cichorium endivia]